MVSVARPRHLQPLVAEFPVTTTLNQTTLTALGPGVTSQP